jgi:hypothetical protein
MHKYVTITIVVDALISMDKLFNQYTFIYHGPHLFRIMVEFFIHVAYFIFVMSLRGYIFYFPKSQNKWVIAIFANYYYKHESCNSTILQAICDMDKLFWNVCCSVLSKMAIMHITNILSQWGLIQDVFYSLVTPNMINFKRVDCDG